MKPRISVIMITYNQQDIIERTLMSLLRQGDALAEICVSDDCSTDGTWSILQEFSSAYPGRFKLHRNDPNLGIFANEEQTWTMPSGDIVYRLAGDDECPEGYFDAVLNFIEERRIDWKRELFCILGDCVTVYPDGKKFWRKNNMVESGIDPLKLKLREMIDDRSACFSINVLKKYVPVSDGRSYRVEHAQDSQLELFTEKMYYLPVCGNVYYAECGVSAHLDPAKVLDRLSIYDFYVDFLKRMNITADKYDMAYMAYRKNYQSFLHYRKYNYLFKAIAEFFGSIEPRMGFAGLNIRRAFNALKRRFAVMCTLFFCLCACSYAGTITVSSQEEFDSMPEMLYSEMDSGTRSIEVIIEEGLYFYHEAMINLAGKHCGCDIHIKGENATLVAMEGIPGPGTAFVSKSTLQPCDPWLHFEQPGSLVQILDSESGQCCIRTCMASRNSCDGMYITLPQWYMSATYPILEIRDGYIHFRADDLSKVSADGYNVNYDYIFGRKYPRYRVFDPATAVTQLAYVCGVSCFLNCDDTRVRSLTVSGLDFVGNADSWTQLIRLDNMESRSTVIRECSFKGMRSTVIGIHNTDDVDICSNTFTDNMNFCIKAQNSSRNIKIKDNTFLRTGMYRNVFCIECKGRNYRITGNRMSDFCYGGISLGVWYKEKKSGPSSGRVTDNELWYTSEYLADKANWTLMDSGAIYLSTQNDGVRIKNNHIHDYDGMLENRGIFCDDGAYGFSIVGNRVERIANCYAIDSRLVMSVETESGSVVKRANVNNTIRNNSTDGEIRFENRP